MLIFIFSSQPADQSTLVSNDVGELICRITVSDFDDLPEEEQSRLIESMDHPVRKCAHASEYFLLGILCCATLLVWVHKKRPLLIVLGWAMAAVYAVSDEIHQIFVPGRAFMVTDILIDSAGAFLGAVIIALLVRAFRCRS